jgi:AraC-like DNA-binding protein
VSEAESRIKMRQTHRNGIPAAHAQERPMMIRPTVLTRVPIHLLEQAAHLGADRRKLMTRSGISPQELGDPDGRIPAVKLWYLWQEVIRQVPDPALGIVLGETLQDPSWFGLVGYTLAFSRTVGAALERLARYSRIVGETIGIEVEARDDRACISLVTDPQFELLRHPIDNRLASILRSLRSLSGRSLTPLAVEFPYPRPKNLSEHRRFFQAPLHFGASRAALHMRKEDLMLPVVRADETLATYLDRLASRQLKELGAGTMTERVGRVLWFELSGGTPSLHRIAERLGVSTRSLQRHLQEEGNPFRDLMDEFRREMAVRLGSVRNLSVQEVAFVLGYADSSSFHRAFRRWYRTSPRKLRRTR